MWNNININNFDIIIDDGLHTYDSMVNFFYNSYDKLKKNGIYIMEDVHGLYAERLFDELKNFYPEMIILERENIVSADNNILIIRKI